MPLLKRHKQAETNVYQVRLFRNGRNQAVRIPRELELPGDEATLRRVGNQLVIEPLAKPSLKTLIKQWKPLNIDWPDLPDPPPKPGRFYK